MNLNKAKPNRGVVNLLYYADALREAFKAGIDRMSVKQRIPTNGSIGCDLLRRYLKILKMSCL